MTDAEGEVGMQGQDAAQQSDDDSGLGNPLLSTFSSASVGGNFLPDLVVVFPLKTEKVFNADEVMLMLQSITSGEVDADSLSPLGQLEMRDSGATLQELSHAVYESLTVYLAVCGCRMKTAKSCNDDELFLLISLGDSGILAQHDKNALAIAHAQRRTFQTKFTMTNTREKLDLTQTMRSELEAAYLEFNQRLVNDAKSTYGPFKIEGSDEVDDGGTIFKQYSDGIAGLEGSFMRTVDRIGLLTGLVQGFIDLNNCLSWGLVVTHYGIHNKTKVEEFCMGQPESPDQYQQGHVPWANVNPIQMLATMHPGHGPPIQEIRDYFGEKAAFYFLWLAHTARALVWWAPFGAILHIVLWVWASDESAVAAATLSSPIFVCVWAQVYLKSWSRLESYYSELWGVASSRFEHNFHTRPEYRGDWVPHPLNETERTKLYSPWKSWCCGLAANAVAFACASLCVASTVFLRQREKVLCTFWMEKLLSLQIFSSQLIWNALTPWLVDLMNPKTDAQRDNFNVMILLPFSIVNSYGNLASIGLFSEWGHPDWGAQQAQQSMHDLRKTLYAVLWPVIGGDLVLMFLPHIKHRIELWRQRGKLSEEGVATKIGHIEEQANRTPFRHSDFNRNMNGMVIRLGYILLFGSVAPGTAVVVLGVFLAKIRIDAIKLCLIHQRWLPSSHEATSIGQWNVVLRLLIRMGAWSTLALSIFNLSHFAKVSFDGKMLRVFLGYFVLEVVVALASLFVTDVCEETTLINAKRARVIMRLRDQLTYPDRRQSSRRRVTLLMVSTRSQSMQERLGDVNSDPDDHMSNIDSEEADTTHAMIRGTIRALTPDPNAIKEIRSASAIAIGAVARALSPTTRTSSVRFQND